MTQHPRSRAQSPIDAHGPFHPLRQDEARVLGWRPQRGKRVVFDVGAHRDTEERYAIVHDGQRWFSFDYPRQLNALGPLGFLVKLRGRPDHHDEALIRSLASFPMAFDHLEYLESTWGDRRIVSHLNVPKMDIEARARLIVVCTRFDLVWRESAPPSSWTSPDRCMVEVLRAEPLLKVAKRLKDAAEWAAGYKLVTGGTQGHVEPS